MKPEKPFARIAYRTEGDALNAYFALAHTLEGAVFLASINVHVAAKVPKLHRQWTALCEDMVREALVGTIGDASRLTVTESPVPDHERARRPS